MILTALPVPPALRPPIIVSDEDRAQDDLTFMLGERESQHRAGA